MSISLTQLNKIIDEVSPKTPEERRAELASQARLDPEEIAVHDIATEWANNCLIVELNIGRARFERALTPPDLGLQDNELEEYISSIYPGRQILVTGEYKKLYNRLNNLDRQARRVVERYGIKTEFGYAVSCIPGRDGITPFEKMLNKLNEIEEQYRSTYQQLIQQLDEIRQNTEQIMYNATTQIWQRMQRDNSAEPPEEFKIDFVKKVMAHFPDRDHVESMYMFRIKPKFVPLNQVNVELTTLEHSALNLRAEIIETIRNSYKEQIEGFVMDVLAHMRQIIYDSVSLSLNALRKTGSLPGPTIVGLRKMIDQVRQLNFANDQDVFAQMERLEAALDGAQARNEEEIGLLLQQLEEENRQFLMALGYTPRVTRSIAEKEKEQSETQSITRRKRYLDAEIVEDTHSLQVRKKRIMGA